MEGRTLSAILEARAAKRPLVAITRIADGAQCCSDGTEVNGTLALAAAEVEEVRQAIDDDRSGLSRDGTLFLHVYNPPLRLFIVGAVHIAQALAPMASIAGFDVTVIDPRGSFATADRFPDMTLNSNWPDEALESLAPDRRSAIVTLTHDPKLDDPALEIALGSDAFYIASLGGQRTHSKRLDRLQQTGFNPTALKRINGPAGLPIGAVSPAEIAVSILAQLTAVRRGLPSRPAPG